MSINRPVNKKRGGIYIQWYSTESLKKKKNSAICSNMDGLGGPFAKGEKSDTKRQILYDITYWWNLKTATN